MNKKQLILVFLIFGVFISPFIFADSLNVNIQSTQDKPNTFYVSNNSTKEIDFRIKFLSEELKEGKVNISVSIFPNDSEISALVSTQEFYFYNNLDTKEKIYVNTKTLTENKTLQLKVEILDKYNNKIKTTQKYITIIPNNSEEYYNYTINHTRPRILGYNLSRSIAVINGKKDSDLISIYVNKEEGNTYSLDCITSNPAIVFNYNYINSQKTDINLSIDKNKSIEANDYFLNCKLQDGYETIDIKEIKIRYTPKEETQKEILQTSVQPEEKNITGFLSLPKINSSLFKMDDSKTHVLLAIFIILIILIIFAKK